MEKISLFFLRFKFLRSLSYRGVFIVAASLVLVSVMLSAYIGRLNGQLNVYSAPSGIETGQAENQPPATDNLVYFYEVSGAVARPGVYSGQGVILVDSAIKNAGGFTPVADLNYVYSNIYLALAVSPGDKIFIPNKEQPQPAATATVSTVSKSAVLNLNTASVDQLDAISGIGPATAAKIIAARPYKNCADINNVKGLTKTVKASILVNCRV